MTRPLGFNPGDLPAKYASGPSYRNSGVIVASGPARVWGVSGYNSAASAVWVMLFDAAAVPADGAAPDVLIYVPAGSGFAWGTDSKQLGTAFSDGLCWAESTSSPALTLSPTDDIFLRADYD